MSRYEELNEDRLIFAALQQLYQRAPQPNPVLQSMQIDAQERSKPVFDLQLSEVSKHSITPVDLGCPIV